MLQGKIPLTAAHHRPHRLGTSISATRALPYTRSFFQPSAASCYDPDDVLPRDSPQMQPHRPKLLPPPSPPPNIGRSPHIRRKVRPIGGDAVLLAHLGNGREPEIAHAAALEPLDNYSDSDNEEPLPKAFDLSLGADAQSPPIRSNRVIHPTISKDRMSGSESQETNNNVDDFAERSRIQNINRIAQRNYRRELRGRLTDLKKRGTASAGNRLNEDRNIHDSRFHIKPKPGFTAPLAAIKYTTISRDHTRGELSRRSALLAHFGRTTARFQSGTEDDQNAEESPAARRRPGVYPIPRYSRSC